MAYYCEVTNLTRPTVGVIMVHFNMHDDTDNSIVQGPMTHGFNAYAERLIADATLVDTHFDALLADAIGYRYPPE